VQSVAERPLKQCQGTERGERERTPAASRALLRFRHGFAAVIAERDGQRMERAATVSAPARAGLSASATARRVQQVLTRPRPLAREILEIQLRSAILWPDRHEVFLRHERNCSGSLTPRVRQQAFYQPPKKMPLSADFMSNRIAGPIRIMQMDGKVRKAIAMMILIGA